MRLNGWKRDRLLMPAVVCPLLPDTAEALTVVLYADGTALLEYRAELRPGDVLAQLHELAQVATRRQEITE